MTADVFSVDPIVFPGGNIGALAATGVCNDLLASGAHVTEVALGIYASADLATDVLTDCLESFYAVLAAQGAAVVCGDTKVHPDRCPDLLLFATAVGVAWSAHRFDLADTQDGDDIIVTGPLGDHAIAVLSSREGLGFESVVISDARALNNPIASLIEPGLVHSLRDLTRGGLLAGLWDGQAATGLQWTVQEAAIPVRRPVRAAAEMLGLDVLALTNEGCMLLTAAPADRAAVLEILQGAEHTSEATVIGTVSEATDAPGPLLVDGYGGRHLLLLPDGLGVPRLC
jgi:hydrogenase expression/formation protein HypE